MGVMGTTAALAEGLLAGWRVDAAMELLDGATRLDQELGSDPSRIRLAAALARGYARLGDGRRSLDEAERVLEAAEAADLIEIVIDALITKGGVLSDMGRSYEGIGALRTAFDLGQSNDLPTLAVRALHNIAACQIPLDPVAAVDASRKGLVDARRLSLSSLATSLVGNGAEAAHLTGQWDWALTEAELLLATDLDRADRSFLLTGVIPIKAWQGLPVREDLSELDPLVIGLEDPETMSTIHGARSHVALAAGNLVEPRAEALERSRLSPLNAVAGYWLAAHASLWLNDVAGATSDLAALEAMHAHGRVVALHRATIRAGIMALEGHRVDALALCREVLQGWRDAGLPVLEALTAIDMAALLDPGLPEVQAAAARARETFTILGAKPFLARLDEALLRRPDAVRGDRSISGSPAVDAKT